MGKYWNLSGRHAEKAVYLENAETNGMEIVCQAENRIASVLKSGICIKHALVICPVSGSLQQQIRKDCV